MQKDKDYADLKAKIAELERMAEKKNVEIDRKHAVNVELKIQLEAAQTTLEKYRAAVEDRINEKEDLMWKNQELQAELERVKAVAEKMVPILERFLKGVRLYGVQTDIYIEGTKIIAEYQTLN